MFYIRSCVFVNVRASGIKLKFTVMVPEDDHNNTVWVGGSKLASTGALDGAFFFVLLFTKCKNSW